MPEETSTFHEINEIDDLPIVRGVDWKYASLKLIAVSIIKNVVRDYCVLADNDISELRGFYSDAMTDELFKSFRIKVHAMKNSAGMFGALPVSSLARLLEHAAQEKDFETISSLMEPFAAEWILLKNNLEEAFGLAPKEDNAEKPPVEWEELERYLDILEDSMSKLDVDTADYIMDELVKYGYSDKEEEILEKLKVTVLNLNPDESILLIKEWKSLHE